MNKRDLLNFDGMSRREFDGLLQLADELKRKQQRGIAHAWLAGKQLAMVFEKPSLRTRATFNVGMIQLGGKRSLLGARRGWFGHAGNSGGLCAQS